MSSENVLLVKQKQPLIIKKRIIVKRNNLVINPNTYHEDTVYVSVPGDFFASDYQKVTIVNRLSSLTNACKTIAKCVTKNGQIFEKTSEEIAKIIGQNNYNVLFSSLCSVLSQELKIRGIWSLLTVPKTRKTIEKYCQTNPTSDVKIFKEQFCQTTVSTPFLKRFTKQRIKRKSAAPYVIKDSIKKTKKVLITPDKFPIILNEDNTTNSIGTPSKSDFPDLGAVFTDDSNNSCGKFSSLSISTEVLNQLSIFTNVDKHTQKLKPVKKHEIEGDTYKIHDLDSNCVEEKNIGHTESSDLPMGLRIKSLLQQGINDWKLCLIPDSEGHLPIHIAVLTNDVELLRRQCLALKRRNASVDIPVDGMTPLKMSLCQDNVEMTSILLEYGADILETDDDEKSSVHIASERDSEHLQLLVHYCERNARKILQENEEIWKPDFESKSDLELRDILMKHITTMYDHQGYTPLMLSSKLGRYNNVRTLVEAYPASVDIRTPNSGTSALYLAIGDACIDAAKRGNKSKIVDHYSKTIEILLENGANLHLETFAGHTPNDLLTENTIAELSMLVANKLSSIRLDGSLRNCAGVMLLKDASGNVSITNLDNKNQAQKTSYSIGPNATKSLKDDKSSKKDLVTYDDSNKNLPVTVKIIDIKNQAETSSYSIGPNALSSIKNVNSNKKQPKIKRTKDSTEKVNLTYNKSSKNQPVILENVPCTFSPKGLKDPTGKIISLSPKGRNATTGNISINNQDSSNNLPLILDNITFSIPPKIPNDFKNIPAQVENLSFSIPMKNQKDQNPTITNLDTSKNQPVVLNYVILDPKGQNEGLQPEKGKKKNLKNASSDKPVVIKRANKRKNDLNSEPSTSKIVKK